MLHRSLTITCVILVLVLAANAAPTTQPAYKARPFLDLAAAELPTVKEPAARATLGALIAARKAYLGQADAEKVLAIAADATSQIDDKNPRITEDARCDLAAAYRMLGKNDEYAAAISAAKAASRSEGDDTLAVALALNRIARLQGRLRDVAGAMASATPVKDSYMQAQFMHQLARTAGTNAWKEDYATYIARADEIYKETKDEFTRSMLASQKTRVQVDIGDVDGAAATAAQVEGGIRALAYATIATARRSAGDKKLWSEAINVALEAARGCDDHSCGLSYEPIVEELVAGGDAKRAREQCLDSFVRRMDKTTFSDWLTLAHIQAYLGDTADCLASVDRARTIRRDRYREHFDFNVFGVASALFAAGHRAEAEKLAESIADPELRKHALAAPSRPHFAPATQPTDWRLMRLAAEDGLESDVEQAKAQLTQSEAALRGWVNTAPAGIARCRAACAAANLTIDKETANRPRQ